MPLAAFRGSPPRRTAIIVAGAYSAEVALATKAGSHSHIKQIQSTLEVASKPCITPASKAQADSESGVRLWRMSIYERTATPHPGVRRGYETTFRVAQRVMACFLLNYPD